MTTTTTTNKIEATFKLDRTTPGSYFYREINPEGGTFGAPNEPGCKIGTFYLRKTALNGQKAPEEITVQLSF